MDPKLRDTVRWVDANSSAGTATVVGHCVVDQRHLYDLMLPTREIALYVPAEQIVAIVERAER